MSNILVLPTLVLPNCVNFCKTFSRSWFADLTRAVNCWFQKYASSVIEKYVSSVQFLYLGSTWFFVSPRNVWQLCVLDKLNQLSLLLSPPSSFGSSRFGQSQSQTSPCVQDTSQCINWNRKVSKRAPTCTAKQDTSQQKVSNFSPAQPCACSILFVLSDCTESASYQNHKFKLISLWGTLEGFKEGWNTL